MKIVSIGEITIDYYLQQKRIFVGGISLNFAVNAKRSGADQVSLISCVGTADGQPVLDTLAEEEVDTSHILILEGKTAECAIEVHPDGDRSFPADGYHLNVLSQLAITPPMIDFINRHDIAVARYDADQPQSLLLKLLESSHPHMKHVVDFGDWSSGRSKPFDPALFKRLDIAFFSGDAATVSAITPLVTDEKCLVIVTLGAGGSVAITPGYSVRQAAISIERLVDTTGCGDAFQAAFTVNYFKNRDISGALAAGARQAAKVIGHYGAFEQKTDQWG